MGTDIHMRAEVRRDGHWEAVGAVFDSSWRDEGKTSAPYDRRNYDVFAILADVRNGYGFAGTPTGEGFVPIARPRGLPDDVSDEVRETVTDEYGDLYGHTWLTVADLDSYDWDQVTIKTGVFSERQYIAALRGQPEGYASGVSGPGVEVVSEDEYLALLPDFLSSTDSPQRDPCKKYYIRRQWQATYREQADSFVTVTIPALRALGGPDDVRIVFSFDS